MIIVILTGFEIVQIGTCRPWIRLVCVQLELLCGFFILHTQLKEK